MPGIAGTEAAGIMTAGSGIAGIATAGTAMAANRGRECSPNRALDKAERLGLRRARIVDVGRRTIDVARPSLRRPHCADLRAGPGPPDHPLTTGSKSGARAARESNLPGLRASCRQFVTSTRRVMRDLHLVGILAGLDRHRLGGSCAVEGFRCDRHRRRGIGLVGDLQDLAEVDAGRFGQRARFLSMASLTALLRASVRALLDGSSPANVTRRPGLTPRVTADYRGSRRSSFRSRTRRSRQRVADPW